MLFDIKRLRELRATGLGWEDIAIRLKVPRVNWPLVKAAYFTPSGAECFSGTIEPLPRSKPPGETAKAQA